MLLLRPLASTTVIITPVAVAIPVTIPELGALRVLGTQILALGAQIRSGGGKVAV
jgi:hypothetical protein